MTRAFAVCAVLLALPYPGRADEPAPAETVIRLTVHPAPAAKPALRYQLLPELREMNPGNPIQAYMKCFMEQNHFFHSKEAVAEREKWLTMPLKDLPLKQVRGYGGWALRQADYAARLDTPDWQTLLRLKSDGIGLLIPEVQQMRLLASALKVRFRGEVAGRRFEDALVTAKTLFSMARHLGEHPTLIGDLVGIAIAYVAVGPLEEMLQQSGCPNLYWALTDLPSPLIGLRQGMLGERLFLRNDFGALTDRVPMTEAELQQFVDRIRELMNLGGAPGPLKENLGDWLAARVKDEAHVRAARRRLVEYGLPEDRLKQFPALQVVLLDERLSYEVLRDEAMKGMALPFPQAAAVFAGFPAKASEESLFGWLIPAVMKVRQAQARLEQRIALLRCVEALRIYAAENGGKLPVELAEVKLPLPVDPVTGKPFVYKLEGGTATVRGTPPPGMEKQAIYNVRYEVTIAK
jgi:hypothetical protein